eukprot:gene27108-32653_t
MNNRIEPDAPASTTVNDNLIELPRGLIEATILFEQDKDLTAMLGQSFAITYAAIKRAEFETFMEVISPWEREYLLLNSPISPGVSWYESTIADRTEYPALDGSRTADVVIVGGGFTGLSAAVHLASAGVDVVLLEAY